MRVGEAENLSDASGNFLVFAAGMMLLYRPTPRSARASTAATLALGLPVGLL